MRRHIGLLLTLLPSCLWICAIIYFEGIYLFLCVTMAACFHECGHLLAFSALGIPAPKFVPVVRGVRLVTDTPLGYRQEFLIALAGPLANLFCFLAGMVWGSRFPALADFGEASLMTALCNLVPMSELDGDRMLRCLIAPYVSDRTMYYLHTCSSAIFLFLSVFGCLVYLWHTGEGTYAAALALASLLSIPIKNEDLREKTRI